MIRIAHLSTPWRTKVAELFADYCGRNTEVRAVVDIGCSDGEVVNTLAERYAFIDFVGIDVRSDELALALRKRDSSGSTNAKFVETYFLDIRECERYDAVIFSEVYEHLVAENQIFSLRLVGTMLRGNGLLIFTCPNGRYVRSELERNRDFQCRYADDFFDDMRQTMHWHEPSRDEMEKIVCSLGYDIVEMGLFNVPFLHRSALGGLLARRVIEPVLNMAGLRFLAQGICKNIFLVARKNQRSRLLSDLRLE